MLVTTGIQERLGVGSRLHGSDLGSGAPLISFDKLTMSGNISRAGRHGPTPPEIEYKWHFRSTRSSF